MNGRTAKLIRKYCAVYCIYHGDTTKFRRFYQGMKRLYKRVPFRGRHQWKAELEMIRLKMVREIGEAAMRQGKVV